VPTSWGAMRWRAAAAFPTSSACTAGPLRAIAAAADGRRDPGSLIDSATTFLAEMLSPFEMTHRGYRDSLVAWRHINETLEQEIRRIAHALHDDSGQLLVSVHLQLAQVAREVPAAGPEDRGVPEAPRSGRAAAAAPVPRASADGAR